MPLYDYFRAANDTAATAIVATGGPASRGREHEGIDVVAAKAIDPTVVLGQLVALARRAESDAKTSDMSLVWSGDEQEGPWLTALVDATRDTLGGIQDDQLDELAAGWSRIEEFTRFGPVSADALRPVVIDFVELARRALDAGDHLYCWMSL